MDSPFSSGQYGSMDGGDLEDLEHDVDLNPSYTRIEDSRVDGLIHEVDSLLRRVADLEGEIASIYHKLKAGDYLLNDLKSRVERFDLK